MKGINAIWVIGLLVSACASQPKPKSVIAGTDVNIEYASIKLKIARSPKQCSIGSSMRYVQRNNIVGVEIGVAENENEECEKSHGEFTVKIQFDNENSELQTLEFEETWSRSENVALDLNLDYQIGFNTTLRSVKKNRSRCWCDETDAEEKTLE